MTQRTVGTQRVTIRETYATTVEDLWDACTNAERIPRWFLPVSGDLRLGGRFQLEGNAGGTIEQCDPPHSFTATWEFAGAVSRITVRVTAESADAARLEIEHFDIADDDHWKQFGPGAVGVGWDMGLLGLKGHLEGGDVPTPEQAAEWLGSPEAKAFITDSARAWGAAHAAAGVPQQTADEAADRTLAAYTGG